MANPVITNTTVLYADDRGYKLPGEPAEVYVTALDADAVTVTVDVTVTDSAGNATTSAALVVQSDPLTYSAAAAGFTVTQDPSQPNKFFVV